MAASVSVGLWYRIWESFPKLCKILATTKHYKKTFLMKQLLSSTNSRFRTQTLKSSPTSCFSKSSLLFNSFYCLFLFVNKIFGSITSKLGHIWMRKSQCLLFVLKRSYICHYITCMTIPLNTQSYRCSKL